MARNLERLLRSTAVKPSGPIDPAYLVARGRRRRRLLHAAAVAGPVAAVAVVAALVVGLLPDLWPSPVIEEPLKEDEPSDPDSTRACHPDDLTLDLNTGLEDKPDTDVPLASGEPAMLTVNLSHVGATACLLDRELRLTLTDGRGHGLDVEGNPLTVPLVETLASGQVLEIKAVWDNWCGDYASTYGQVEIPNLTFAEEKVPFAYWACDADQPSTLRKVD